MACHHQNEMLNRNLLTVRLNEPLVDWINAPYPCRDSFHISVEFANDSVLMALQPIQEKPWSSMAASVSPARVSE